MGMKFLVVRKMRGRGVIVYWVGTRDLAAWLTLCDYHDHHDLGLTSLGDMYMHCIAKGCSFNCLFVGRLIKVDIGYVLTIFCIFIFMDTGVL